MNKIRVWNFDFKVVNILFNKYKVFLNKNNNLSINISILLYYEIGFFFSR